MLDSIDLEERLCLAIEFAVTNGWELYHRPNTLMERIRKAKHVCAYGAGNFFQENLPWFSELYYTCKYVCDNDPNKWHTVIAGKKCISPAELKKLEDVVVIISIGDYKEAAKQFNSLGIENYPLEWFLLRTCDPEYLDGKWFANNRDDILRAFRLYNDNTSKELFVEDFCNRVAPHMAKKSYAELLNYEQREYFTTDALVLKDNEYFVDAGAYDGDTIVDFISATGGQFGKIYAFELAEENFERLQERCKVISPEKIRLFCAGVSDCEKEILIDGSNMGWRESKNGPQAAKLVSIDNALAGEKITFIKMDIEGSEFQALQGCSETIRKQTPKLAICTYHLLSDLWKVPLFIKTMNSNYQLYLRHHSKTIWDTVCYAAVEENGYDK